ncbi:MAG: ECF-type sigma factor [Pyrinomonadaceae bacterium]
MDDRHDITRMLREWSGGNPDALDLLLPLVYKELHRQAASYLRRERIDHTLQATALINEAYMKLVDQHSLNFEDRTHFFAISARLMRQILVDHARTKKREKRGGSETVKVELDEALHVGIEAQNVDLIALDDALTRLGKVDEQQARLVELRYFSGLSLEETADAMGVSRATAARDWTVAKAWLKRELTR